MLKKRLERYGYPTCSQYLKAEAFKISKANLKILRNYRNPQDIYNICDEIVKDKPKIKYITQNLNSFHITDVDNFINSILNTKSDNVITNSDYRKLFMAYSLIEK